MELSQLIVSAEKKYKNKLEDFFSDLHISTNLSSHGIDHHKRVWSYGKELLNQPEIGKVICESSFAEKLIIACYLHDAGMSVDPGPSHGVQSRIICGQFLKMYNLPENIFIDVLDAIENHDNKDYSSYQSGPLLAILSVADDLDAFGFTGVFRYLEIYLTRNKPIGDLGHLIIENVGRRYNNFVWTFGQNRDLIKKHGGRYQTIVSFFNDYNKQCNNYQFDTQNPSGFCGVAEMIKYSIEHNMTLPGLFSRLDELTDDKILKWYFSELGNELSLF